MKIGYACLTIGVPDTKLKALQQKNADPESLVSVARHNLAALDRMFDYNLAKGIKLFRISSDIIPFGSSTVNDTRWWQIFGDDLSHMGDKIKNNLRASMHPGQYTVLNSLREDVVERSVLDLAYHCRFLDCLGTDNSSKIVLHIGGLFGDREKSIDRFCRNFELIDTKIKNRLVIENDERMFNIEDALAVSAKTGIPVVFDNLHHNLNQPRRQRPDCEWIKLCQSTWSSRDGQQKIHYSQQAAGKKPGAHSATIDPAGFVADIKSYGLDLDIMLEVKDKNLSAVKCINCLNDHGKIRELEDEWQRYKYEILEKSPVIYQEVRELLKDKKSYPALEFYRLLKDAENYPENVGFKINAAQHVWGYFRKLATDKERQQFSGKMKQYEKGTLSDRALKMFLWRLAVKYRQGYLLNSLYLARTAY